MKQLFSMLLLFALFCCGAKEYTVELDAVPGDEQIFFLDLRKVRADSSTFRLTTPDGKEVPFSFDMRLERSMDQGKFKTSVNGYYSKVTAPAAERKFEFPGFLSFKKVAGIQKYIFKFKDGASATVSRPTPAVRGWWIEVMRDPFLTDPRFVSGRKGSYKILSGGGLEMNYSAQIRRSGAAVDERIAGRRIFTLLRCKGPFSYFSIDLKNGAWDRTTAIACYFRPSLDVLQDICVEGLLASENVFNNKRRHFGRFEYVKGPSIVKEFHVQLPPIGREMGVSLESDLYNEGDIVNIKSYGGNGESALPFESGSISGMRYGVWKGKTDLSYELKNASGKSILKGKGRQFSLKNVKEGSYTLTVDLRLEGTFVTQKKFPLKIQQSPF